jgi:hypothetical protein
MKLRPSHVAVTVLAVCLVAYGICWYWRATDTAARALPALMSRLPLISDATAEPLAEGSGLFVHDTMVAVLKTINKVPVSVGDRDTIFVISGNWLSSTSRSLTADSTLAVVVDEVPDVGSRVVGSLRSDSRRDGSLGIVRLADPAMVLSLLLNHK